MKYLKNDVVRLAGTYLIIIMVMSIAFSAIFYNASIEALGYRPPEGGFGDMQATSGQLFLDYLDSYATSSQAALLADLVLVNMVALVAGGLLSYVLARHTLRPIEENMEAQMRFVSDASHELRTPLTALRAANEVALRHKKLKISEAREVMAGNIEDINRLQNLADSMLGLLRDDGVAIKTSVSLSDIVSDAMGMIIPQAQAKNIAVEDAVKDIKLRGNAGSLTQLVTILLDNAIKYSPDDSTIYITSSVKARNLLLSIRDEGVGMDADTISSIFTRFYRAEESRNTKGYGLGLAIAKKVVEAHGGRISVKSQLGNGTTFTVVLPISNAQ